MISGRRWLAFIVLLAVVLLEIGGAWYLYSAVRARQRGQYVGEVSDFPPNAQPYAVGTPVAPTLFIVNTGAALVAFAPYETNDSNGQDCRVKWQADRATFRDPCLGATYTLEGRRCDGPAWRNLDQYPLQIVGEQVWVNTMVEIKGDPAIPMADGSFGPDCS